MKNDHLYKKLMQINRRLKGLNENIILIESEIIKGNHYLDKIKDIDNIDDIDISLYNCRNKILSATNKIYIVTMFKRDDIINFKCSCLDNTYRNKHCKHIYWLGFYIFNSVDPNDWNDFYYDDFFYKTLVDTKEYRKNENCPICLEKIHYESQIVINCKNECLNSVHAECWCKNLLIANNINCVLCKSSIL